MKILKLIALWVALWPLTVSAGPVSNFHWVAPTEYTNGSPIGANELTGFVIYCGPAPNVYNTGVSVNDPTATSYPISSVVTADGEYYCVTTASVTGGEESSHSNMVHFFIVSAQPVILAPAAPSNFRIQ